MTAFAGDIMIAASSPFSTSTAQEHNLGARAKTADGKIFRYVLAGASALVQGKLYQAPAPVDNHQNLTPTAAAVGATSVTVTLGATAATANQYAGGLVVVTVTPGEGYAYRIASHPAASSAASLTLTLEDPILVAWTSSTRVDLVANSYSGIIINAASPVTSAVVGAAVYPVAAGSYGWIQTGGLASVLNDATGTLNAGIAVSASNGAAGAVEALSGNQAPVGISVSAIAANEYGPVRLLLDS